MKRTAVGWVVLLTLANFIANSDHVKVFGLVVSGSGRLVPPYYEVSPIEVTQDKVLLKSF